MNNRIKANARFVYKSKTDKQWQSENPILLNGEIGFVSDINEGDFFKVGDGVTAWNELPYKNGLRGEVGGYYKPFLENGVLYFVPSKDDMPSIESADLNGSFASKLELEDCVKNIGHTVKTGLIDSKEPWTDAEKAKARTLLDAVGKTEYPAYNEVTGISAGVVKVRPDDSWGLGIEMSAESWQAGYIQTRAAEKGDIHNKTNGHRVIVPSNLDYAVKKGLTNCKETWDEVEKSNARTLLGALGNESLIGMLSKGGCITSENPKTEAYVELEASTIYIFIHNSGNADLQIKLEETDGTMTDAIDCAQDVIPNFQAVAILVPKNISTAVQNNYYDDKTALLMGVTGKTLGVPQTKTLQFFYDKSASASGNERVNYGKMHVYSPDGSMAVWKIKL